MQAGHVDVCPYGVYVPPPGDSWLRSAGSYQSTLHHGHGTTPGRNPDGFTASFGHSAVLLGFCCKVHRSAFSPRAFGLSSSSSSAIGTSSHDHACFGGNMEKEGRRAWLRLGGFGMAWSRPAAYLRASDSPAESIMIGPSPRLTHLYLPVDKYTSERLQSISLPICTGDSQSSVCLQ